MHEDYEHVTQWGTMENEAGSVRRHTKHLENKVGGLDCGPERFLEITSGLSKHLYHSLSKCTGQIAVAYPFVHSNSPRLRVIEPIVESLSLQK